MHHSSPMLAIVPEQVFLQKPIARRNFYQCFTCEMLYKYFCTFIVQDYWASSIGHIYQNHDFFKIFIKPYLLTRGKSLSVDTASAIPCVYTHDPTTRDFSDFCSNTSDWIRIQHLFVAFHCQFSRFLCNKTVHCGLKSCFCWDYSAQSTSTTSAFFSKPLY